MARILVIDDDDQLRVFLRRILEKDGHEVADAPNGAVGIMIHRENPADLVITDIFMPEKEGISTIMDLNRNFPKVKIIAISGGGRAHSVDYLELAKNLGAARAFQKPFDKADLLEAIKELLQQG